MRQSFVRRILAALFVVVGLGVASSAVHADATPTHAGQHQIVANDWQW